MKIMKKNLKTICISEWKFRKISQEMTYAEIRQPPSNEKKEYQEIFASGLYFP